MQSIRPRPRHAFLLAATIVFASPARSRADDPKEPTVAEVSDFMRRLAEYVRDHHLKRNERSPQKGMVYEYFDVTHAGKDDAWIEGEALDSMHDGAWFAAALTQAARATGDPLYRELLTRWILPFYVETLNNSDTLFDPGCNSLRGSMPPAPWPKEHLLVERERGFLPYWWDDGASVSLEASRRRNGQPPLPTCDRLAGMPNPQHRLAGYSLASSNHLGQDLGVMLLQSWLLLRESPDTADRALAGRVAQAAGNLAQSRLKRHGAIPAVMAAVAPFEPSAASALPAPSAWNPDNAYTRALVAFYPGQRVSLPGFADDDEYQYFAAVARTHGHLPRPVAERLIYDAYTLPKLYRFWSDDQDVSPGMNRFDLCTCEMIDGRFVDCRSTHPLPAGSRLGPQLMLVSAWALQALATDPGLYDERYRTRFSSDARVNILDGEDPDPKARNVSLGGLQWKFTGRDQAIELESDIPEDGRDRMLRIYGGPDLTGSYAEVRLRGSDVMTVVNDRGNTLGCRELKLDVANHLAIRLPYTVFPGQTPWANGIEHGRLSVAFGGEKRNLYLLSPEDRVRRSLRRELVGGIRTWKDLFDARGYIPTSIGAGGVADRRWDNLSDTGGYAHLISAMAQYLFLEKGQTDWQGLNFPHPQSLPTPVSAGH